MFESLLMIPKEDRRPLDRSCLPVCIRPKDFDGVRAQSRSDQAPMTILFSDNADLNEMHSDVTVGCAIVQMFGTLMKQGYRTR